MKILIMAGLALGMTLMAKENNVLVFAGSTRSESVNKKLANKAVEMAREMGASVTLIDLKDYPMPFYDGDLEEKKGMPENAKKLRNLMIASQCIVIASPEYNGSLPAVLKNAIDWASRSEDGDGSRDAFTGKKFVIMSASPGKMGGKRALSHLSAILENIGGEKVVGQISVPNAFEKGALDNTAFKEEMREVIGQCVSMDGIPNSK